MRNKELEDKLIQGLGDSIDKFVYYGGSFGSHLKYFTNIIQITNESPPIKQNECACGHFIKNNCYIKHNLTKQLHVVGSCCINKFMTKEQKSRKCVFCGGDHKNNKNSICNNCRLICCKYCNIRCGQKICEDCDLRLSSNKKRCQTCDEIFRSPKFNHCKDCRVKCYVCDKYHVENKRHQTCDICNAIYFEICDNCKNLIKFGKYKGNQYNQIDDISYVKWCYMKYKKNEANKAMIEFVEYYLQTK